MDTKGMKRLREVVGEDDSLSKARRMYWQLVKTGSSSREARRAVKRVYGSVLEIHGLGGDRV